MILITDLLDPEETGEKRKIAPPARGRSGRRASQDPFLKSAYRGASLLRGRPPQWLTAPPKAGRGQGFKAPNASPIERRRRVIAKLSYVGRGAKYAGKVTANAKYLARRRSVEPDEGHEHYLAREGPFFTKASGGITAAAVAAACQHDPRQFRLILNLNDGDRLADMKGFVRQYMARIERAVGARIAWAAVIHKADTVAREDNRHAHVIIRGTDLDGRDLRFARDFVKIGFRSIAEELATEMLGPMTDRELAHFRAQQEKNRERAAALRRADREGRSMATKRSLARGQQREPQLPTREQDGNRHDQARVKGV